MCKCQAAEACVGIAEIHTWYVSPPFPLLPTHPREDTGPHRMEIKPSVQDLHSWKGAKKRGLRGPYCRGEGGESSPRLGAPV